MKKVFIILLILVCTMFAMVGCLMVEPSEEKPQGEEPIEQVFYIGDTQTINGLEITVLRVENETVYNFGSYETYRTENNYCEVKIRIKNVSSSEQTFYYNDYFMVQNESKYNANSNISYGLNKNFNIDIIAGATKEYVCVCETMQSSDDMATSFIIKENKFFSDKTAAWKLEHIPN